MCCSYLTQLLIAHTISLQVDQAALTGESLPVKKYSNDVCFSGSTIKQGEKHAIVYATGANTFFGRAAALIGATNNVANLQKIMTKIGGTCLVTIGVWIIIELAVQFGHYRHACAGGESMFFSPSPAFATYIAVDIAFVCLPHVSSAQQSFCLRRAQLCTHHGIA